MGKDANLKAKNVRWMVFSLPMTLRCGLIVGVVGAHCAMHGDLLEKVVGNRE